MRRTLEGFAEVTEVDFIPHRELFGVEYQADGPKGQEFQEAVLSVIVAPGVRQKLGDIGSQLGEMGGQNEAAAENNEAAVESNLVH